MQESLSYNAKEAFLQCKKASFILPYDKVLIVRLLMLVTKKVVNGLYRVEGTEWNLYEYCRPV